MAKLPKIEATPENVKRLTDALESADAVAQEAETAIQAFADSVKLLLLQPDSGGLRGTIATLIDQIKLRATEASDTINAEAEQLGCNYISEQARNLTHQMYEAARGASPH